MRLISTAPLAVAVSRAQGLGFIAAGTDVSSLSSHLSDASSMMSDCPIPGTPLGILPIGIGFICWGADLFKTIRIIKEAPRKPAVIWLFAPRMTSDFVTWTKEMRVASNGLTKIWVQVGNVGVAVEVARLCEPDALVIQGADAGGHGLKQSSSIITLLPECADSLERNEFGSIPLIAAGGIVEGRGAAASLALGASGICMGTRFLASHEAVISNGYREAVVMAKDGGITTARTSLYDQLRGTTGWPDDYNGRGVLNRSYWDAETGMSEEENKKLYEEAMKIGDNGWGPQGRIATYAGTGVGLVVESRAAGEIVMEVVNGVKVALETAKVGL